RPGRRVAQRGPGHHRHRGRLRPAGRLDGDRQPRTAHLADHRGHVHAARPQPRLRRDLRYVMSKRARCRAWRRSRPFWGGLLLIVAGVELVLLPLSGVLVHGGLKLVIYIGIGGVFGVLIGALLIAAGTALLVNPVHRSFYGIAGIILGIAFFLGMLLAIVGGALGYAWAPVAADGPDAWPAAANGPGPGAHRRREPGADGESAAAS